MNHFNIQCLRQNQNSHFTQAVVQDVALKTFSTNMRAG